jgi:hypothetical protein
MRDYTQLAGSLCGALEFVHFRFQLRYFHPGRAD